MAFVATPHCARLVINFRVGTFDYSNVMHCTKTDFVQADLETLVDNMDTYMGTEKGNYLDDVVYVSCVGYDIRTLTGQVYLANAATGAGTAGSGDSTSPSLAVVVTLRTAARGRSGRGRQYISGFGENSITDGIWTASTITGAGTIFSGRKTVIENAGWTLVIRSTQQDGVALDPAVTREVTSYEVRSGVPGIQRRRLDRP